MQWIANALYLGFTGRASEIEPLPLDWVGEVAEVDAELARLQRQARKRAKRKARRRAQEE